MINQILLFLILPALIHSKNSCPTSTCGNNFFPIKYPFKLPTDHPPENCNSFIDLSCSDHGRLTITLPFSGEFYVASIDYTSQRITLTDPGNCLPGRLMVGNLSVYPLDGYFYVNYTFFTCPRERIRPPFTEIECLSNATNGTVATTDHLREFLEEVYGCTPIVTSLVPVSGASEYNASGNFVDLQLGWNGFGCRECDQGYAPADAGGGSKKTFYTSPAFISVIVLASFFMIAFLLRIMKLIPGRATATTATAELSTTTAPPGDGDTPAVLPQTASRTQGIENSEVKNFSEAVREGEGTLVSCSICLEEYNDKDRVRKLGQCGHYFHVGCIDEWLQKYSTCPICRTSLS